MQQRQAVMEGGGPISVQPQKEKSMILSELVELTEYSRAYASRVLRQHGRRLKSGKQSLEWMFACAHNGTAPGATPRR
jgi:hypothetical protein